MVGKAIKEEFLAVKLTAPEEECQLEYCAGAIVWLLVGLSSEDILSESMAQAAV